MIEKRLDSKIDTNDNLLNEEYETRFAKLEDLIAGLTSKKKAVIFKAPTPIKSAAFPDLETLDKSTTSDD